MLKDASSTSIYGARAANGVIVITTKRGRIADKGNVTARVQWGLSSLAYGKWDLMNTTELVRRLDVSAFKKGEISTKVKTLNDCKIIKAPSVRMKSAYDFNDGSTDFGFAAKSNAVNIGCIVLPRKIVNRVMKTQKMRFWTPDQNIDMDAYKLDFRFVYDFLVKKSALDCIWAYSY